MLSAAASRPWRGSHTPTAAAGRWYQRPFPGPRRLRRLRL